MKGIVFDLLEGAVIRGHGEDARDDLLDSAGLKGGYTSLGSYPDRHPIDLVAAASAMTGDAAQDVIRWFGREAMPVLASSFPRLFDGHTGIYTFFYTLNDIIHPEVRKLYPGATCRSSASARPRTGRSP